MVVQSLDVEKDPFHPKEDGEAILGHVVPYLSAIGALMYLANCTWLDIAFSVNLLAIYSSTPTRRCWNSVKHLFCYLHETIDMSLFYPNRSKSPPIGYADAGYLFDPHKAQSQMGYLFNSSNIVVSWWSIKQTTVATSLNHS